MSLSDVADLATIVASILAALGVSWLVYVQRKRHQRVQKDLDTILNQVERSLETNEGLLTSIEALDESDEEVSLSLIAQQLSHMSVQLTILQHIGVVSFLRKYEADREVASLLSKLSDWELRSPVTRRE